MDDIDGPPGAGLSASQRWRSLGGADGALQRHEEGCRWTGDVTAEIDSGLIRQCNEGTEAGKITDLNFRFRFVKQITGLEQCAPHLRSLDLSTNNIRQIEGLAGMNKLRELKLFSCQILRIQNLEQCVSLSALHLEDNQISALEGLDALRSLEYLNLDRNRVQRIGRGVCKLSKLRELHLSMNQLSSLEGVAGLSCLEMLSVGQNRISQVTAEHLKGLTKLDEMLLGHNQLRKLDFLVSVGMAGKTQPTLPSLNTLDVSSNRLGSDALNGLLVMHQLGDLNLSSNQIDQLPSGFASTWPALEILDLSGNQLHRPQDLELLKQVIGLKELTLEGNPVVAGGEDEAVQKVLAGLSGLELLDDRPCTPAKPEALTDGLEDAGDTFRLTTSKAGGGFRASQADQMTGGPSSRPSTGSRPGTAQSRPGTADRMKDMREAGVKEPLMHMGPKLNGKRFASAEQVSQWEKNTLSGLAAVEKQISKTNSHIEKELTEMTKFLDKAEQVLRREKELQSKRPNAGGYPAVPQVSRQLPVLQSADSPEERRSSRVKFRLQEALDQSKDGAEDESPAHELLVSAPTSPSAMPASPSAALQSPIHAAYDEEIVEEDAASEMAPSEMAPSEMAPSEVDDEEVPTHEEPLAAAAPPRRAPNRSASPHRLVRSISAERPELRVENRADRRNTSQSRISRNSSQPRNIGSPTGRNVSSPAGRNIGSPAGRNVGSPAGKARPPAMPVRTSSRGSRR
mmetsp:Transcript_43871/g.82327  ORF Transcript_43871/g.82327 Transcript_43871/m.82327 type:complete len:738 (-) Transcript_43871:57-2270(-)